MYGCPGVQSKFIKSVFLVETVVEPPQRQQKAGFIKWTFKEGVGSWVKKEMSLTFVLSWEETEWDCALWEVVRWTFLFFLTELHKERIKSNLLSHMMGNQVLCDSHRLRVKLWFNMWLMNRKRWELFRGERVNWLLFYNRHSRQFRLDNPSMLALHVCQTLFPKYINKTRSIERLIPTLKYNGLINVSVRSFGHHMLYFGLYHLVSRLIIFQLTSWSFYLQKKLSRSMYCRLIVMISLLSCPVWKDKTAKRHQTRPKVAHLRCWQPPFSAG